MKTAPELREILIEFLQKWLLNQITEVDLHQKAEELTELFPVWPNYKDEDPASIPFEVLSHLEMLNSELIIQEDVACILGFLQTPPGKEKQAWHEWLHYWENVDYNKRRECLKGHGYYLIS